LINELAEVPDDLVLVLDDLHQVDDPTVYSSLTFFIDHLPSGLHLVLASRSQPPLALPRWRVRNQLYELREDDLRFSLAEVAAFFNENKGMNLSPEEIASLGTRTEGWIAGLQLVALSMKDFDDVSKHNFVSAFTGSQRYILDFLVEEVLQRQPEHIRTFLLKTALLERLSASLCNAVTGQPDGQAVIEHLERANMFTIALDQERQWYRYHHLFRDVLRHELQRMLPEVVHDLHRRAAAWYIHAGQTDDAIRHACEAHEWGQALDLIETVISTTWNRGEIRKVITWLEKLPDEYLDRRIHLTLYYSRALMLGGEMEAADKRLRESEKMLRARLDEHSNAEDRLHLGTICTFRTTIAAVAGEMDAALALGSEALRLLPLEHKDVRAHAINSLGGTHYYLDDMVEAARACAEAGNLARQVGNLYLVMVSASYQAKALISQGQLKQAGQILEQALSLGISRSQPVQSRVPAASVACASFGHLLYEWNQLEEAERFLIEAIELGEQLAYGSALWSAYLTLARIRLAHGDRPDAERLIEQAHQYRLAHTVPLPSRIMDAEQASVSLVMGQMDAATLWAHTCSMDRLPSPGFIHEFEQITLARLHLLQGQPKLALSLLDQISATANSKGHQGQVLEILILTALAQNSLGKSTLAINTLRSALALAEPEGYVRTFVDAGQPMAVLLYQARAQKVMPDYVRRLLEAFPADGTRFIPGADRPATPVARAADDPLIEPLSTRELEVLQLMAGGASNQDIAETLIIAFTTAKKHVSNVIRKLGVDNRMQAVAKGRELGLFE
jgi:LuxR family maltose regulon positive regulatory protein